MVKTEGGTSRKTGKLGDHLGTLACQDQKLKRKLQEFPGVSVGKGLGVVTAVVQVPSMAGELPWVQPKNIK